MTVKEHPGFAPSNARDDAVPPRDVQARDPKMCGRDCPEHQHCATEQGVDRCVADGGE
jgi:hypothetical protein